MGMPNEDVTFIEHLPCDACGSSDANALYSDGHTFCFACQKQVQNAEEPSGWVHEQKPKQVPHKKGTKQKDLLQGVPKAIPARGLTEETCRRFGYWVGQFDGEEVQIAVYRDEKGQPQSQKVRTRDKRFITLGDHKAARLFGSHLWSNGRKLVVAEGEIDAMSIAQAQNLKFATVSVASGAAGAVRCIKDNWDYVCGFDEVVLMFDQDEPGQKAALAVAEALPVGKARIAHLPYKDANECLVKGRAGDIIDAIFQSKPFRPDGIKSALDYRDVITVDEAASAISWPYSMLNEVLRGLRKSELVTVAAGSGTGKTTFCKELAHHLMMSGQRVGIIALEESNKRTLLGLVGIHLSKNLLINRDMATDEEVLAGFDDLFGDKTCVLFDSFGSNDVDLICQRIQYMARAFDVDYLILDHISLLVSQHEGDERRNLDAACTKFRTLVQELDIGMIMVSHLRRPDGRGHEDGAAVSLSQLRGSHAIAQLSDACIGLQVDPEDPDSDIRHLRILKNRFTGQTGDAGTLVYNRETGRLMEQEISLLLQGQEDNETSAAIPF